MDYLWLFLMIFFLTILSNKKNENLLLNFTVMFLIFYFGFSTEIGMDTKTYYENFLEMETIKEIVQLDIEKTFFYRSSFEKGYVLIGVIIKSLTNKYIYFSFFNMLIIMILFIKFIKKYSTKLLLSLLILLRGDIFSHLGGSRQGIAQGIYLYALININDKSFLHYLIYILIASFFHKTIIIFIPIYFIIKNRYKTCTIIKFLLITISLYFVDLREIIQKLLYFCNFKFLEKYLYYLESDTYFSRRGMNFNSILTFLIIIIILTNRKKIEEKIDIKNFNIIFNNYLIGFFFNVGLNSVYIISYRISQYFQIFDIIIYTYLYTILKDKKLKILYITIIFIYCYISFYKNMLLINYIKYAPYKNYFIN